MTKFVKGQKNPNPGGRPKLARDLAAVQECTDGELKRIIAKHFRMTIPENKLDMLSETIPTIEVIIARALVETAQNGKIQLILPLIDRAAGKIKEVIQHEGVAESKPQVIVYLPDNGRQAKIGPEYEHDEMSDIEEGPAGTD